MPDLDPGGLTAILSVTVTFIATIVAQNLTARHEMKKWQRQQDAEERRSRVDRERQERDDLRNHYQKCMSLLTVLNSNRYTTSKVDLSDKEFSAIYKEVIELIALLDLHRRFIVDDHKFGAIFDAFTRDPSTNAGELRNKIHDLAITDKLLFPNAEPLETSPENHKANILIDLDFKKQQIIGGDLLNDKAEVQYDVLEIKASQREKMLEMFKGGIPQAHTLYIPSLRKDNKRVVLTEKVWMAKINPNKESFQDIFDEWEKDYEKALADANQELSQEINSEENS